MCYALSMLNQTILHQIFWDRPDFTVSRVKTTLQHPDSQDYYWLLGRLVERLPANQLFRLVPKSQLYAVFPKLKIWHQLSTPKAQELFSDTYTSA